MKGDTASGGVKPAKLSTGAVVRVPLFVDQGEVIKVDTRSKEYVSRVKYAKFLPPSRETPFGQTAGRSRSRTIVRYRLGPLR
jgi:hypothetical protein